MSKIHAHRFLIGTIFLILTASASNVVAAPPEGMVLIKKGCFNMGTDKDYVYEVGHDSNGREQPAHKVCLDAFYMDIHETTQKLWTQVMKANPAMLKNEQWPVDNITWEEASRYCKKRKARLPTEAEWEYAALAGSSGENSWGDGVNGDYVWYATNSSRTPHPVGTRKANQWGLHDMMGSVWEWVSDWYDFNYYKKSSVQNPKGPKDRKSYRVIRGGSWLDDKTFIRAAARYRGLSDGTETFSVGVRCAKPVKGK